MGTLQTTIRLNDEVSKKLNDINRAINRTVNAMNNLNNTASAKAVRNINKLAEIEVRRGTQIEKNTQAYHRQNSAVGQQISQHNTLMKQIGQWATKLRNIATIYYGIRSAIQGIGKVVGLSDKMTMADARLGLMTDKNNSLKDLQTKTFGAAMRSRTGYLDFTKAVTKMGILAGDKFANQDSIIRFTELMNKQFQVGGADTSERNAAMLQLTQAIASNRLGGDELRTIRETAPLLVKYIQKSLGVGEAEFKQLAKEGEITADVIIKAMAESSGELEKMFNKLPLTWESAWTRFKNVGVMAFQPIQEQLKRLFNNQRFLQFMVGLQNAMIVLGKVGGWVLKTLFDLFGWIADKCIQFKSVLLPIVYIMGALVLATFAYYMTVSLIKVVTFIYGALKTAIMAVTSAQWLLNVAMSLNPVGLVIAAIVFLIALFYGAVAAINHFCGTSISATGIVAGAFMALGANIYNMFVYLWNAVASWVEFFANVFKHPVYSVKKLFVNLASNVIDACIAMTKGWDSYATSMANAMIDAVNFVIKAWNKLVDFLPESVVAKLGLSKGETIAHRTSITSDLTNAKASLQSLLGEAPSDYWTAPKMEYKVVGDAFNKGYNAGSGLESKLENLTKLDLNMSNAQLEALNGINNGVGDMSDSLGDVAGNTGDTAKNTGDTAKNTSSAYEQDYSYLRNWAYQKGMGNSIGYNIKIEQNNKNNIGSNMDLNRVIDAVRDAIIEGITVQAEGV